MALRILSSKGDWHEDHALIKHGEYRDFTYEKNGESKQGRVFTLTIERKKTVTVGTFDWRVDLPEAEGTKMLPLIESGAKLIFVGGSTAGELDWAWGIDE